MRRGVSKPPSHGPPLAAVHRSGAFHGRPSCLQVARLERSRRPRQERLFQQRHADELLLTEKKTQIEAAGSNFTSNANGVVDGLLTELTVNTRVDVLHGFSTALTITDLSVDFGDFLSAYAINVYDAWELLFSDDDTVIGSDFDDELYGFGGGDTMKGGLGGDRMSGDAGRDTLEGGRGNDELYGDTGHDILFGGRGGDLLDGGKQDDILTGGRGADKFLFSTPPAGNNVDTITDFAPGSDMILLSRTIFSAFAAEGPIGSGQFATGPAADGDDLLSYRPGSGKLFYDADGSGDVSNPILVAILDKHLGLSAGDFEIVF